MTKERPRFTVRVKADGLRTVVDHETGEVVLRLPDHGQAVQLIDALVGSLGAELASYQLANTLNLPPPPVPAPAPHAEHGVPPSGDEPQAGKAYTIEEKRRTHPRAYEPWDSAEEERLIEMTLAGWSTSQIGRQLGRNPGAISSRLRRLEDQGRLAPQAADNKGTASAPPDRGSPAPDRSPPSPPPAPTRSERTGGTVSSYGSGMVRSPGPPEARLGYTCTCGRFVPDGAAHDC